MDDQTKKPIIGFPHRPADGGPGSFQIRLTQELKHRGFEIVFPEDKQIPHLILVVGGTAKLKWLWDCKKQGTKIIYRLDGINWRHRVRPKSIRDFFLSEIRNYLMVLIRNHFADHVIYQSQFIEKWWHQKYGRPACKEEVIYNGVDLSQFHPKEKTITSEVPPVLLCVEGNVQGDPITLAMLTKLSTRLHQDQSIRATLVCGGVAPDAQRQLEGLPGLKLLGKVPREAMHAIYAKDAIFLVLEINPPCPNSVIEALASGIPVVGFETGSLQELVTPEAGKIVDPDSDLWKLESPNIDALEAAIREILPQRQKYGRAARTVAETHFGLEKTVNSYINVFQNACSHQLNLSFVK